MAQELTKPGLVAEELTLEDLIDGMEGGHAYISEGAGFEDEASMASSLADQSAVATLLAASFDEFGTFQEEAWDIQSKVELKKTYHFVKQGKRTTTITMGLAGLNSKSKSWLENKLNRNPHTIIIQSMDKDKLLVFNGLKWVMEWSNKVDDWFNVTVKTEFSGTTKNKVVMLECPEGTAG